MSALKPLFQKRSLLQKLFFFLILVGLIPLLSGAVLFYRSSVKSLDEKISIMNQMQLERKADALMIVLENILDLSQLLLLDSAFMEYAHIHHEAYFERYADMAGKLSDEERYRYLRYIELRAAISEKLELLPMLNEYLNSVLYFDEAGNTLFISNALPEVLHDAAEIGWYKNITGVEYGRPRFRILLETPHSTSDEIALVFRDILNGQSFFLIMDRKMLYDRILSDGRNSGETVFLALSDMGEPILAETDGKGSNTRLINMISLGLDFSGPKLKIGDERYFVNKAEVHFLGWRFYSFVKENRFRREYRFRGLTAAMLISALSLSLLLIGYVYIRIMYKPFAKLFNDISSDPISQTGGDRNLYYIKDYIDSVVMKNNLLKEQLSRALPSYRKDFLNEILTIHEYSVEEINERFTSLHIRLPLEHLKVLLILIDDKSFRELGYQDQLNFKVSVENTIKNKFECLFPGEILEQGTHLYAYICQMKKECGTELRRVSESLISEIRNTHHCESNIVLGPPCRSVYDLPRAYHKAEELLNYQLIFDKGIVLSAEETLYEASASPKNKESLEKLIRKIEAKLEKKEGSGAQKLLKRLVHEMYNCENRLRDTEIRELESGLMKTLIPHLPDEMAKEAGDTEKKMRLKMHRLNDKEMSADFFSSYIDRICGTAQPPEQGHIKTIFKTLEEEYGENINLTILAEKMHLNPSYLSRMFKEQTGVGFIEYLTDLRMEKASAMLLGTEMSIQEICRKTGYWNTNYFIKIFKKKTGSTPGEYRKSGMDLFQKKSFYSEKE